MDKAHPLVVSAQTRIFANHLRLSKVLDRAHVHRTTWYRWASGQAPQLGKLDAVWQAIDALVAEKESQP